MVHCVCLILYNLSAWHDSCALDLNTSHCHGWGSVPWSVPNYSCQSYCAHTLKFRISWTAKSVRRHRRRVKNFSFHHPGRCTYNWSPKLSPQFFSGPGDAPVSTAPLARPTLDGVIYNLWPYKYFLVTEFVTFGIVYLISWLKRRLLITLEDCLITLICLSLWCCNDSVCIICFFWRWAYISGWYSLLCTVIMFIKLYFA